MEVLFWGERSLVPMGKIEKHVLKGVLAKSMEDTASFLQFLEMQKYLFWRKCMVEFIVVSLGSFEHCLASGSQQWSQEESSLWCGESAPTCLGGILTQVFGRLV